MAYTEFYCDAATGNNMNGGSDAGSPSYTHSNGAWNSSTGVYTPTSGNPSSSVTVGQWASVFTDGSTTPVFSGRVTAVSATTITVSVTIKVGNQPGTAGSGLSIRVGGAWLGPNGTDPWPIGSLTIASVNSSGHPPRCNLKNNAAYVISAQPTQSQVVIYQGYSSSPGDGGQATIDGTGVGSAIGLWNQSGEGGIVDLIFANNGSSGSANAVAMAGGFALRCVVHDVRGNGFSLSEGAWAIECEAYACNGSNGSNSGGFSNAGTCIRCISHDNSGSNSCGFIGTSTIASPVYIGCIADSNGADGFKVNGSGSRSYFLNCDAYNNAGDGFDFSNAAASGGFVENCIAVLNGAWGVVANASGTVPVVVNYCAFGSGTKTNASGTTSGRTIQESNTITLAANTEPWIDAANGDFRISSSQVIGVGRGSFTQTASSYSGAVGAPVVGACQVAGYPAVADVELGVTYANGAYTGTFECEEEGGDTLIVMPNFRGGYIN